MSTSLQVVRVPAAPAASRALADRSNVALTDLRKDAAVNTQVLTFIATLRE